MSGQPISPDAVAGDWLVGILQDQQVIDILGLVDGDAIPVYGYITWYYSDFDSRGNPGLLPFDDPNWSGAQTDAIMMAARILEYFNANGVQHIIVDVRCTEGGTDQFWSAFATLVGGPRAYDLKKVKSLLSVEPTGSVGVSFEGSYLTEVEAAGAADYTIHDSWAQCDPDLYTTNGLRDYIYNCVWNGDITGQTALGLESNIIWLANSSALETPEGSLAVLKGTSFNKTLFDGDFGRSTRFVMYGVKTKPFSTTGDYTPMLNTYARDNASSELNTVPPMFNIDRWEAERYGYVDGSDDIIGGTLKALDQDFDYITRPQIVWDMNAAVFFKDIGYTNGNAGLQPGDGPTWLAARYPGVVFRQPLTYRDSTLERAVQMAYDPDLIDHFYVNDTYGWVSEPA